MINTWKTTCFAVAISALGAGAATGQLGGSGIWEAKGEVEMAT